MKRVVLVALLALLAGCADGLTAPRDPAVVSGKSAANADGYCFIELDGCVPYQPPPPPPPTPLVPFPCHWELRMDEYGRLYDVLVCS